MFGRFEQGPFGWEGRQWVDSHLQVSGSFGEEEGICSSSCSARAR